jgi:hypothetical protein
VKSNVYARKTCIVWDQMFVPEKHVIYEIKCLCKKNMYCLRSNVCARKTCNIWNQMFVQEKQVMYEIKCLCKKNM